MDAQNLLDISRTRCFLRTLFRYCYIELTDSRTHGSGEIDGLGVLSK